MKKTTTFALVAVLMIAFAACGTKETKQFSEMKASIQELEQYIDTVETCDNLLMVGFIVENIEVGMDFEPTADDLGYAESEMMTLKEKEQINQMLDDLSNKLEEKSKQLECDKQLNINEVEDFFEDYLDDTLEPK